MPEDRVPGGKPVLKRPPIGGTEEELKVWADAFVDASLAAPPEDDTEPSEH